MVENLSTASFRGHERCRVMHYYTMAFMGMAPFGSLLADNLAHRFGAPHAVMTAGAFCVAGAIWLLNSVEIDPESHASHLYRNRDHPRQSCTGDGRSGGTVIYFRKYPVADIPAATIKIEPMTSTSAKMNRLIPFKLVGRVCDLKGGISMLATMVATPARPMSTHQLKSAFASASCNRRVPFGMP
jgi:hypothetical protein